MMLEVMAKQMTLLIRWEKEHALNFSSAQLVKTSSGSFQLASLDEEWVAAWLD